jgi:hypothetical protein
LERGVTLVSPANRLDTMPLELPARTLGWEAVNWASMYLRQPNGPKAGQRFEFTLRQLRFLLHWYALDEDGNWVYHHGVRRLAKGSGKSPFAAALALIELCAKVRLDHFTDDPDTGGCVGRKVSMPLVQIAAVSEEQTKHTMRMVRGFAPKGSRVVEVHHLDPGLTRYYSPDGELHVMTSSAKTAEGAEATFIVGDEALALSMEVPTPDGWAKVEQIEVGDRLFGSNGPVTVTHVTDVFMGRPCYRVTFEDGTEIVADAGHLWQTKIIGWPPRFEKIRTTEEMALDGRRFAVPRMRPFDGPDLDLPMDPYVLGLWLGDGASAWAGLAAGEQDLDLVLETVRRRGVPAATVVRSGNSSSAATISLRGNAAGQLYTKDGSSIRGALIRLGVLAARETYKQRATWGSKHIPPALLRASLRQRLDLLRGLMDSDGWVSASSGRAVFVNANRQLADDVLQLVRTLGYPATMTERQDMRWPSNPVIYKVSFRPDTEFNPFLLPRKAQRVRPPSARRYKTIRSFESVDSVPVKCIEVDSDDHLFVAGDGWTLTHNTEWWLGGEGEEFMNTLADNLAKSGSRMLETENSWKPGAKSQAQATWDSWVKQEEDLAEYGDTKSGSLILYDAVVAPPDTDISDPVSLERALRFVYADCDWKTDREIKAIMTRIWDRKRSRPDDSKRKYLNWPVVTEDAWCDPQQWATLAGPRELVDGERIVIFFDGSKTHDATAAVGCCLDDGYVFVIGIWEPRDEVPVDAEEIDNRISGYFDRFDVVAFFADVREWEGFVKTTWPDRWKDRLQIWAVPGGKLLEPIAWDMRSHSRDFALAAEMTEAEILDSAFVHDDNAVLARHMGNARRYETKWQGAISVKKETPNSANKIDGCVAVIGARMVYRLALAGEEPSEAFAVRRW